MLYQIFIKNTNPWPGQRRVEHLEINKNIFFAGVQILKFSINLRTSYRDNIIQILGIV